MFKTKILLEKEEEFVRLNAELDLETKDLLEQVDHVMKLHELKDGPTEYRDEVYNGSKKMSKMFTSASKSERYKRGKDEDQATVDCSVEKRNQMEENGEKRDSTESENGNDPENGIFSKVRGREDEDFGESCEETRENGGCEDFKDERYPGGKPFFSLNREKSNKNLKSTSSGKASVISTTNIGQGLTLPGKLTRHKSEIRLKERTESVLPESLKGMGQEGVVRFLKAKVKMLTEQLEILQKDEKKHVEKIKDLQGDRERAAEDRDKWIQQANIAKNVLVKHEQHASNIVMQLQNTQAENGHLKKEIEKLKKELKLINQNSGSNEVRLNRSIEETEKLKAALRQSKQDEKDLRETQRKKTDELSGAVKRLDKQRVELLHAFKKQLVIIDNLRKQRGLMEAGKLLKSIEDDFMEFLDWNPNKI